MRREVYLDHAATTAVRAEVLEAMLPYFREVHGNASSIHSFGRQARNAVDFARARVADAIEAKAEEIVFTSGGTESDNLAILGACGNSPKGRRRIITSSIEHHAVLNTFNELENRGFETVILPVDSEGFLRIDELERALNEDTLLVSVMAANNEIGTLQPIAEIGALAHSYGALMHTDAVQAIGAVPIAVDEMNVDLLSMSGHKYYGPKGVGALYIRQGVKLSAQVFGGTHERMLRAGTENVPGIVGLGEAVSRAVEDMESEAGRQIKLRDMLIDKALERICCASLNGHREKRLMGNVNLSFECLRGDLLVQMLDMRGIAVSTGSACSSGSVEPSHVLMALGMDPDTALGSLRITLGRDTTQEDVDYFLEALEETVERCRASTLFAVKESASMRV